MAIVFQCNCGKRYQVDESLAGRKSKCQGCGALLTIPIPPAPQQADPMAVEPLGDHDPFAATQNDPFAQAPLTNQSLPPASNNPMMAAPVYPAGGMAHQQHSKTSSSKKGLLIAGIAGGVGLLLMGAIVVAVVMVGGGKGKNKSPIAAPFGPSFDPATSNEPAKPQKPVTMDDAKAFAATFGGAVNKKNSSQVNSLIHWDELFRRSAAGLDLGANSNERRSFFAGVKHAMTQNTGVAGQLVQAVRVGGQYKLVRIANEDGNPVPLFRLLTPDGGVNYHKLRLHRNPSGQVRIADLHIAMTGENLSITLRRNLISLVASKNRSLWQKLTGDEVDLIKHGKKLADMTAAMRTNPMRVLQLYMELPDSLKKQKNVLLLRMSAASQVSMDAYIASINDFRQFHRNDPAADIISLDLFVTQEEYNKALASIERLQKSLGGDPYMTALTGKLYLDMGKPAEAKKYAEKALKEEPELQMGYFVFVLMALTENDNDAVLAALKRSIHCDPPMNLQDFAELEPYNAFRTSPQYQEWQKFKRENSKPK